MSSQVTASMLYDLLQCSYRLKLDTTADIGKRDQVNAFVQMLWKKAPNMNARLWMALSKSIWTSQSMV